MQSLAPTEGQGSTRVALASSASTMLVEGAETAWRMVPLWISSPFLTLQRLIQGHFSISEHLKLVECLSP